MCFRINILPQYYLSKNIPDDMYVVNKLGLFCFSFFVVVKTCFTLSIFLYSRTPTAIVIVQGPSYTGCSWFGCGLQLLKHFIFCYNLTLVEDYCKFSNVQCYDNNNNNKIVRQEKIGTVVIIFFKGYHNYSYRDLDCFYQHLIKRRIWS